MTDKRTVKVPGDRMFRPFDATADENGCTRGTPTENWAHDMEAVEVGEGGPTVLYCRRGCGKTEKLEG